MLMRHAKSAWDESPTDHVRPLNGRGRRNATAMGPALLEMGLRPDFVLTSDAARALETVERMRVAWPDVPIQPVPGLYLGGLVEIIRALAVIPDTAESVLIVGHNPGLELCARAWGLEAPLKTADLVVVETNHQLAEAVREGRVRLVDHVRGRVVLNQAKANRAPTAKVSSG